MFQLAYWAVVHLIQLIQPLLVPICFITAWGLVLLSIWQVVSAVRDGFARAKQMHQIPCASCAYFTNSHFLKCPLHPQAALTETAIDCSDYENDNPLIAASKLAD
ncbi:hypothetical protein C7271_08210 [filamentous cyanobacterium CCP5]|nr:hypothetical protein C7271_08210 [filamentous cyanobacterium CCP5]